MNIQSLDSFDPAVTAVSGTSPTTMTSPPPTPTLDGTLAGISQQLGMSVGDVQSALKQGMSITDLAQQQNVSRSSLVQSVESQIQQTRQANGQPPLDQTTLDRIVNRAFNHHRHHHGAAAAGATGMSAPASVDPAAGSVTDAGSAGASDNDGDADGSTSAFSTLA